MARHHPWRPGRPVGYFDIPRELFIEREIPPGPDGLGELKFYTFGERITRIVHISGRFDGMRANVWIPDDKGTLQRSEHRAAVAPPDPSRPLPARIDQALQIARRLGSEFDHLRVDLLWDGAQLWLGELTVYNQSGRFPGKEGTDPEAVTAGAWDLRRSAFLRQPPSRGWRALYARALRRALNDPHQVRLPPLLQRLAKPLKPLRSG